MSAGGPLRDERGRDAEPVSVSPAVVPLLLGGVLLGFFAGYLLAWWGAIVVAAVLVGAAVLSRRSRESAVAAALGVVVGYALVIALAFFRGVI